MAIIIRNATNLQNMENNLSADYELGNDIDVSETSGWNGGDGFLPVGVGAPYFTGTLDGKGYTITGLVINRNGTDYVGLFAVTDSCTISNLTLISPTIHGEDKVAALCGTPLRSTITNCHIVGGTIIGNDMVGGLIGSANIATTIVSNSHTTCSVTSDNGVAGANNMVGGFIGYGENIDFDKCYATGAVVGIGEYVGGFIGYAFSGTINQCLASGNVETGDNGGDSFCGGFVGWSDTTDIDCYARGSVTATGNYVGGYAGVSGDQTNCYSTGAVSGVGTNVGGLNGDLGGTTTDCFWDKMTSGQATSFGGDGKTTTEMKTVATFADADWAIFRIWDLISTCNDGYPCLIGVNPCCIIASLGVDNTIVGNKVSLEAIRNIEMAYGGRFYIGKAGDAVYESRYHRNV